MCFFSRCIKIVCVFIFLSALIGIPDTAEARVVDDVRIEVRPDGFQIRIDFSFLIFYESHTPPPPGQEIHARIRPINLQSLDAEDIDLLRERMPLSWDQSVALPLKEITFEGGDTNNLELIYTFTKDVEYHVSSTPDLRSIIVDVKTEMPAATLARDILPTSGMDGEPGGDDAALRELMDNAKDELTNGRYSQAIQLYTKVLRTAQGPLKQEAQEYPGPSGNMTRYV